jgi:hypothetical protein
MKEKTLQKHTYKSAADFGKAFFPEYYKEKCENKRKLNPQELAKQAVAEITRVSA